MFHFDDENKKLCKVIKLEDVPLPMKCLFFGHVKVHHAAGGCKRNRGLWYQLYSILEEVDLKAAAAICVRRIDSGHGAAER